MSELTDKSIVDTADHISEEDSAKEPIIEQLTEWSNEPSVSDLKNDLQAATPDHDAHTQNVEIWLNNLNVEGKAKPEERKGYSSVQPKLIRKQAEWRYAALSEPFLNTDDLFTASPVTWEDKKSAEQNQLLLNTQIRRDIDKVAFIDQYVRTAVDEGTVIIRTGWEYQDEVYEVEKPIFEYVQDLSPEAAELIEGLSMAFQQDPIMFGQETPEELQIALNMSIENQTIMVPVEVGTEIVEEVEVLVNRPTAEICNYNDVIIDPSAKGDIDKAAFVIYRFDTSYAELLKDGKYVNLDHINIQENSVLAAPDSTSEAEISSFQFSDKPRKRFYAHEYWGLWDVEGDGVLVPIVATFVGNTMIRLEENPFPDKKPPFVSAQYLPVRESNYGQPDGYLIEDNQKIVGAVTRGMIDLMARSANAQQGIRKDALDPVNRRKYERGDDYEFNPGVDPRLSMYMHQYPEIPASAQFMLSLQNADAEALTGVIPFSNTANQGLGETATEVRGALNAASKRELGILRRLANGIVKMGRKWVAMNAEFLSEEEVVRVTHDEFVPIRRDDLAGKIDLTLKITTAEENEQKAGELSFMLQTVGPNTDFNILKMILSEIAKLRKMPELAQRIEAFEPQPDPLQQQIQQLEIAKLQAEIQEIQSRTVENYAQAQLDQVKAGNVQSDTDLKDLDFVEKESGTTHARDVDKITAQAEAQTAKSIIESRLPKPGDNNFGSQSS